jgi:hypothetical protein
VGALGQRTIAVTSTVLDQSGAASCCHFFFKVVSKFKGTAMSKKGGESGGYRLDVKVALAVVEKLVLKRPADRVRC